MSTKWVNICIKLKENRINYFEVQNEQINQNTKIQLHNIILEKKIFFTKI